MTESEIANALDELVELVQQGKPMEAFEKFYGENLDKADLDGKVVLGKEANRKVGYELLSKVRSVRDFSRVGQVIRDNRSFLVWSLDFDHEEQGRINVIQVAIQDWENGKIVKERFYA